MQRGILILLLLATILAFSASMTTKNLHSEEAFTRDNFLIMQSENRTS